jgi:uncharacterized membrane protein YsdA (DUF1294 family)
MATASLVILGRVQITILYWYIGISFITFIIYANDKRKAKNGRWRTPENILHLLAFIGGWPGGAMAQQLLRHKTQKRSFRFRYWLTVIGNIGVVGWLLLSNNERLLGLFL